MYFRETKTKTKNETKKNIYNVKQNCFSQRASLWAVYAYRDRKNGNTMRCAGVRLMRYWLHQRLIIARSLPLFQLRRVSGECTHASLVIIRKVFKYFSHNKSLIFNFIIIDEEYSWIILTKC